jgi:tetratricopeptide (TPR) repeat protein
MNCDNGQIYERYWDIHPSMNGAEVMSTLRPVATQIANLWNQLSLVPAEAPGAFEAQAQAYRAAATKPELPESAREFKVRAESAVAEKRFLDAVEAYDRALQVAPWWPQGHFNVALVLGELKTYGLAVKEMQRYLALAPDAANARQAQDKIYAWRGKLEKAL